MTVKELKEKLNEFDDNLIVMIPNKNYYRYFDARHDIPAKHISRGCNEADGCIFIDDYEEDGCSGCIYENADDTTDAISNCVCCSKMNDLAKDDNYVESI